MISTKGRYALRFLVALSRKEKGYASIHEIAEEENISAKYLEKIVHTLTQNRIIESHRGKEGGYRLTGDTSSILVSDILIMMEDKLAPVECICDESETCHKRDTCRTRPMWEALYRKTMDFLSSVTLENLRTGDFSF